MRENSIWKNLKNNYRICEESLNKALHVCVHVHTHTHTHTQQKTSKTEDEKIFVSGVTKFNIFNKQQMESS